MIERPENLCERLDAFLGGDLSQSAESAFAAHLDQCAACREAVDQQAWIEGLLRSREAAELEAAPAVRAFPLHERRRPTRRRLTAAAAAVLVAASMFFFLNSRRAELGEGPPAPPSHSEAPTAMANAERPSPSTPLHEQQLAEPPVATFVSTGPAIALPSASRSPNVTVVTLYPTLPAARRWTTANVSAPPLFLPPEVKS